jgi:uncharacterized SAM-binding protein YcdF (DUF218 family)
MAYAIGKLAYYVLQPSNLLLILSLAGLLGALWRRRWGLPLAAAAVSCIAVCTLLPIGNWLAIPLENRFPAPSGYPADIDGIVVLGGGADGGITRDRGQPSFRETMERFAAIPELARQYPQARLVFTGGPGWNSAAGDLSEAEVIGQFIVRQGLPRDRVLLEGMSRSTRQNALLSSSLAQPRPGERWLLVTSATHMPRAMGVFRRAGWPEMLPWPVDYRTSGRFGSLDEPRMGARMAEIDQAAYEWYGLVYYRLLGYTDDLFPRPLAG